MDPTYEENAENDKFQLLLDAVRRFEEYETAVTNNTCPDDLLQYQNECLNLINEWIFAGSSKEYIQTALFYIREDLLNQIVKTESRKEQISVNGVTITRTNNPTSEPFIPSLRKIFAADFSAKGKKQKDESSNRSDENCEKLKAAIENTLIVPQSTGFAEIAGLEEVKNLLREAVVLPIQFPQLFTGERKKWNKALLYGPPGTGKTFLAHCLAAEIKAPLYFVSNSDLLSSYVGESEKLIKILFQHCQETNQQCLIFIDEIDSLCRVRNSRESESERRCKNQLLIQLSEMDRNPNNSIFFLACTNCPWDLDSAFIRRFQRRIYIPLPDRQTRIEIFKIQIKSPELFINSEQWEQILDQTEGWAGSDISDLINCATLQPVKEIQTAEQWILTDDLYYMPVKDTTKKTLKLSIKDVPSNRVIVRPVQFEDIQTALQSVTRTVSSKSLKQFEEFNEVYGSLKN